MLRQIARRDVNFGFERWTTRVNYERISVVILMQIATSGRACEQRQQSARRGSLSDGFTALHREVIHRANSRQSVPWHEGRSPAHKPFANQTTEKERIA